MRSLQLVLICISVLSLTACGGGEQTNPLKDNFNVENFDFMSYRMDSDINETTALLKHLGFGMPKSRVDQILTEYDSATVKPYTNDDSLNWQNSYTYNYERDDVKVALVAIYNECDELLAMYLGARSVFQPNSFMTDVADRYLSERFQTTCTSNAIGWEGIKMEMRRTLN